MKKLTFPNLCRRKKCSSILRKDKNSDYVVTTDAIRWMRVNGVIFRNGSFVTLSECDSSNFSADTFGVAENFGDCADAAAVEDCQSVLGNATTVGLSKSKHTYSRKAFTRVSYGFDTNSECDSPDYPYCLLVEDTTGQVEELRGKAISIIPMDAGNFININIPESLPEKSRGSSMLRKDKNNDTVVTTEEAENVINIDIPESLPEKNQGSSMLRKDKHSDDVVTTDTIRWMRLNGVIFRNGSFVTLSDSTDTDSECDSSDSFADTFGVAENCGDCVDADTFVVAENCGDCVDAAAVEDCQFCSRQCNYSKIIKKASIPTLERLSQEIAMVLIPTQNVIHLINLIVRLVEDTFGQVEETAGKSFLQYSDGCWK